MNTSPDATAEGGQDEGRPRWTLGPNHPDFGATEFGPGARPSVRSETPRPRPTRTRPTGFRCSRCGAAKPAARSLCPCGAFGRA